MPDRKAVYDPNCWLKADISAAHVRKRVALPLVQLSGIRSRISSQTEYPRMGLYLHIHNTDNKRH